MVTFSEQDGVMQFELRGDNDQLYGTGRRVSQ
jgi:hypothetical protein